MVNVGELIQNGRRAEFGRLIEVLGRMYLGHYLEAVTDEDGQLEHKTLEDAGTGTVITTQPEGIAFRVGDHGTPVSMGIEEVNELLAEPLSEA